MKKPTLPLATLEAIAEVEQRTQRLLARLDFKEFPFSKLAGILCACAIEIFDKEADFYRSLGSPRSRAWIKDCAKQRGAAAITVLANSAFSLHLDMWATLIKQVSEAVENHARAELRVARTAPPGHETPSITGTPDTRDLRLKAFIARRKSSVAAVCRAANVDKKNMQQWRRGELSDGSVMSQRIEDVLTGRRPVA
jgi:hypothetical protein